VVVDDRDPVVVDDRVAVVGGIGRFVGGIRGVGRPRKRDVSCARGGGRSKGGEYSFVEALGHGWEFRLMMD